MGNMRDDDLIIRTTDRYQEIPDSVIDDLRPRILKAIDNFHCTLFQIKRNIGVEMSVDISPVLEALESDGTIRRLYNGVLTAFFRAEKQPVKFWMAGNDKVAVDYKPVKTKVGKPVANIDEVVRNNGEKPTLIGLDLDNRFNPTAMRKMASWGLSREETARKANIELTWLINKLNIPNLKKAWDEGRREFGLGLAEAENILSEEKSAEIVEPENIVTFERVVKPEALNLKSKEKKRKFNHFAWQIEKVAAFSKTQEETANKLGMTVHELNAKLRKDPELKEAYNRGRQQYKDYLKTKNREENMQTTKAKGISWTKEMFFDFGKQGLKVAQIAKELDVVDNTVNYQLKKSELQKAYNDGLKEHFANEGKPAEKVAEPKSGNWVAQEGADMAREKILNALRAGHRNSGSVKEASGLNFLFIPTIQGLLADGLISSEKRGDDVFYDLVETAPAKDTAETALPIAEESEVKTTEFCEEAKSEDIPGNGEEKISDKDYFPFNNGMDHPCGWTPKVDEEPVFPEKTDEFKFSDRYEGEPQVIGSAFPVVESGFERVVDPISGEILPIGINPNAALLERFSPEKQVNLADTHPHNSLKELPEYSILASGKSLFDEVARVRKPTSNTILHLGETGSLELSLNINLFEADKPTRDFVNNLVEMCQAFNQR